MSEDPYDALGLDPSRIASIAIYFDRDLGYADNHFFAMQAAAGRGLPPVSIDLTRRGFELVRAMAPEQAIEVARRLTDGEGVVLLKDPSLSYVDGLLASIFEGPVGDRVRGHFRSEFSVMGIGFRRKIAGVTGRNALGDETYEKGSAHWHCDGGPTEHLKLLVYLSDLGLHDGGTIFIDRPTTDLLKRAGVVFQPRAKRQLDLHPFARSHGFDYQETLLRPGLGEAALFQPANVLHRARLPERGERITMTLLLLPSAGSWRKELPNNLEYVLANHGSAFPHLPARLQIKA